MGLSYKRRKFVEEYLKCWNASEAAKRAGYKGKANVIGPRLLANVSIQEEVNRRLKESAMEADEVLSRLSDQGRVDLGPYLDPVICEHCGSVGQLRLNWEKLKADGLTHLIKSVIPTRYGDRIEFHDAQSALGMVGKAQGMFKERIEHGLDEPTRKLLARIGLLAASCITDPYMSERFVSEMNKLTGEEND